MTALLRLRQRKEWRFFAQLPRADAPLALAWWTVIVLHGIVPVLFAIATGVLVAAVQRGGPLAAPLTIAGVLFVLVQVLTPVQTAISHNLGDRMAAFLYDRLTAACVQAPGLAHLEDPALAADLTVARDFDLGMTGPPLSYSMDFIAGGLVGTIGGLAAAVVLAGFAWWAPVVLAGAWLSTHWLLRESSVWFDRNTTEVRMAQRDADYAYRLAVDPPASKELRLFGLIGWTIDRFVARRTRLHQLQYEATRLRERPLAWSLLIVTVANVTVLWVLAARAASGAIDLGQLVIYGQCVVGTSLIAFGGLNWALDGAAAPVEAVERLEPVMASKGHLAPGTRSAAGLPAHGIRFHDVRFAYPGGAAVLDGFDLTIPAGASLAIVG
jgi:ABC-type multidrug transport system fused ATPase/permease subunit